MNGHQVYINSLCLVMMCMTKERLIAEIDEFLESGGYIDSECYSGFVAAMVTNSKVRHCLLEYFPYAFDKILSDIEFFKTKNLEQLFNAAFIYVIENRFTELCKQEED